ncbi:MULTISPECIES: TadE/TadG family type IV pilus assembly protein [Novosphingobium]|uniref:TadE-like protein n=1 Tax=Novosphingobium mathurense TaxID=428990 RepID=A0A1U6GZ03_9SPHN|nr:MULTISPECIES: TadE family protein [Novosphingobium]CDO38257.1 TadE-like protein [Novosphingobium sp. KN65.2]SLJ88772.1 TadE-like protein [Novosphingobium mathurense]
MKRLLELVRDQNGASAAEFALVLPILLIALIGTIDVGLYAWNINQAEKATQTGARWAVATDMVASGLKTYSFAVSGGVPQGTVVDQTAFPGVTCQSNGTTASCTCASGGTCNFPLTADNAAFGRLVTRMAQIDSDITASNVVVTYAWSGLGFSGDPNGPDVAPLTTVSLRNMTYTPLTTLLFQVSVPLPSFAYALTMEDGSGTVSN